MRFSTRGRYGVQLMVDLALHSNNEPISLKSVADRQKLSEHYLEQLVPDLRKVGMVKSIRGAQGGYILAKDTKDIIVGDIIRALEGPIAPVECSGQKTENCCEKTNFCLTREVWVRVSDSINDLVDSISLADLVCEAEKGSLTNLDEIFNMDTK